MANHRFIFVCHLKTHIHFFVHRLTGVQGISHYYHEMHKFIFVLIKLHSWVMLLQTTKRQEDGCINLLKIMHIQCRGKQ